MMRMMLAMFMLLLRTKMLKTEKIEISPFTKDALRISFPLWGVSVV